mgnify:CR=1 FL=1
MYLNSIPNFYNQNFQARIKMSKSNLDAVMKGTLNSAAGVSVAALGAASLADAAISGAAISVDTQSAMINDIQNAVPKEVLESHKEAMWSTLGENGVPMQSFAVPSTVVPAGSALLYNGTCSALSPLSNNQKNDGVDAKAETDKKIPS